MARITAVVWTLLAIVPAFAPNASAQPSAGAVEPIDPARMAEADRHINDAVARGDIPGAVLLVGRGGGTLYLKAYGSRSLQPGRVPMTADTVFDLASLSKPI